MIFLLDPHVLDNKVPTKKLDGNILLLLKPGALDTKRLDCSRLR